MGCVFINNIPRQVQNAAAAAIAVAAIAAVAIAAAAIATAAIAANCVLKKK